MAVLVPIALLLIVAIWLWITVRSEARQRVERISGGLSDHVRRVLEAKETILESALARLGGLSPEVISSDRTIHEFLARLQAYSGTPTFLRVVHIATGQVVASSSGHPPVPLDLSEHDYLKAHRAGSPETYIGEVIRAPLTGELGFTISRRDAKTGLLASTVVPVEPLRTFFRASAESTRDAVTFARQDGEPLTMYPGNVSLEHYRLPDTAVFMRYQRGELRGTEILPSGIDGHSRVWSISRVGPYPVQVLYGLDITAVQSLWFRRLLPFALISLLGSGVLLATGARLRRAEAARLQAEADARWAMARANHADALAASEARSRLAIEATGLGTWDEDLRTRQTTWNEHAYRIFGFRPGRDTMTSATWRERVHPDDWPQVAEAYRTALKDGALYRPEHRITRADGSVRWLNPYGNFLRTAKGEAYRFVGVFADITERKQADALVAEREARYRTLFTSIDEGFCLAEMIVDVEGKPVDYRFIEVNPLFETMTGLTDATGSTARDLIPDLEPHWIETYGRVGLGRETLRFESSSAAMKRSFDVFAAPVEPHGCFVLVFKDVTDRKRAEEQKALLMRELSHRAKNLLSVIQSVARQTARHARDLADFETRFAGRVGALAVSIDRLVHQDWAGADLAALVRDQMRIFLDPESPRLILNGPTVRLTPEATQNIGLALHELGTNAAKYGALTNASGAINVAWSVSDPIDGPRRFEMLWSESGGPPIVEPAKPGFGSTVITVLARMSLDAEVSLEFPSDGARWRFSCPADKALDGSD